MVNQNKTLEDFIAKTYIPRMKHYHRRAALHQRGARSLRPVIIGCSVIATCLASALAILGEAIPQQIALIIKVVIAVCSALAAALSSILKEGDHEKKWHEYDRLYKILREELDLYNVRGGRYLGIVDRGALLVERFHDICKTGESRIDQLTVDSSLTA